MTDSAAAKSGSFPSLEDIPGRLLPLTPDFMQPTVRREHGRPNQTYQSARALGQLYRQVGDLPVDDFTEILRNEDVIGDGESCLTEHIVAALRAAGLPADVDEGLLEDARGWMADFSSALRHIAFDNSDGQGVVELHEVECVSGTIAAPPLLQKHRKSLLERLEAQSRMLANSTRLLMTPTKAGRARRAAGALAAWTAANELPFAPPFGARSYALVSLSALFECLSE